MLDSILAYAAGLLTLINPCVLPLLPLIGASAASRHPQAPIAMAAGMAVSFTIAGLGVFALTRALGLSQDVIATAAGWMMIGLGTILLVPRAQAGFSRLAGAAAGVEQQRLLVEAAGGRV